MINNILLDHYYKYPLMRVEDFFKLIFQGEYGSGHAIDKTPDQIAFYIAEESKNLRPDAAPVSEIISSTQLRVNLAPFKEKALNIKTLAEMFVMSGKITRGSDENFQKKLAVFEKLVEAKQIGLPYLSARSAVIKYLANVTHPHHSVTYKLNYNPHYRVLRRDFFDLFPVIDKIDSLLGKDTVLLAIEGNSGSGKSYYADVLKEYYSPRCNVFHTDDFFLPSKMRTEERLGEIGGNIHYERLQKLLSDVKSGEPIKYQRYSCRTDSFKSASAPIRQINILEGVYSTHPSLIQNYDAVLRLKVSNLTQQNRLLARSGAAVLEIFNRVWLPLENKFFAANPLPNAIFLETDSNDVYSKESFGTPDT